jgi:hypothetical protein
VWAERYESLMITQAGGARQYRSLRKGAAQGNLPGNACDEGG